MSDDSENRPKAIRLSEYMKTMTGNLITIDYEEYLAAIGKRMPESVPATTAELYESLYPGDKMEIDWPTECYYPPGTDIVEINMERESEVIADTFVKLFTSAIKDLEPGSTTQTSLVLNVKGPKEDAPPRNVTFESLTSTIKDSLITQMKPLAVGDTREVLAEWTTSPDNKPKTDIYDINKDTDFDVLAISLVNVLFSITQRVPPGCNMRMELKWSALLQNHPVCNPDLRECIKDFLDRLKKSWKVNSYQAVSIPWVTGLGNKPTNTSHRMSDFC